MIDNDSILWIVHEVSATTIDSATRRQDALAFNMRNRIFSDIFVFQRYTINPETGAMTLRKGDDLGPGFVLEPVKEERLLQLTVDRISRIKEIRKGTVNLTKPDPQDHVIAKDPAEMAKIRQAYLENFLKQLP